MATASAAPPASGPVAPSQAVLQRGVAWAALLSSRPPICRPSRSVVASSGFGSDQRGGREVHAELHGVEGARGAAQADHPVDPARCGRWSRGRRPRPPRSPRSASGWRTASPVAWMAASSPDVPERLQRSHRRVQAEHASRRTAASSPVRRSWARLVVAGVAVGDDDAEPVDAAAQADHDHGVAARGAGERRLHHRVAEHLGRRPCRRRRPALPGAGTAGRRDRAKSRQQSGVSAVVVIGVSGHRVGLTSSCGRGCRAGRSPAAGTASWPGCAAVVTASRR